MRSWRTITIALALALVATGCVGTISRSEFEEEIQSRGGGFTQDTVIEAVDAIGERVGTHDFEVLSFNLSPQYATVTTEVRDPSNPGNVDTYSLSGGSIDSIEPEQVSASDNLDADSFVVTSIALDDLDAMADAALAEYDAADGYITSMSFIGFNDGPEGAVVPVVQFSLESSRSSATARFAADGSPIEFQLQ